MHGTIVSREPIPPSIPAIMVRGDSLSAPWVLTNAPVWQFTIFPGTAVLWVGGGVADTSDLSVGRIVWVQLGSEWIEEPSIPYATAGVVYIDRP
jgi:hypothetical protein